MKKFEYLFDNYGGSGWKLHADMCKSMNAMGEQGWEVVGIMENSFIDHTVTIFYKREKEIVREPLPLEPCTPAWHV